MKLLLSVLALSFAITVQAAEKKPILIVLTNHGELGKTGKPTGFFLSEAAHPWEVFRKAGYPVVLGSPKGGFAPVDPKSFDLKDKANAGFWKVYGGEKGNVAGVPATLALNKATAADYAAIFFAGGHGTMWDFSQSKAAATLAAEIYENGGAVGAVCHGPAALVNIKLSDGSHLVKGRKVAGFTNAEEAAVQLTDVVPYLLQDSLTKSGASVVIAENFKPNAVRDGRLATGQNPASATKTAELLIEALQP